MLWTDGSKLGQGHIAAALCWKDKPTAKRKEKNIFLGKNNEILDADLWAILEALDTVKRIAKAKNTPVTILCDSQKAIALPFTSGRTVSKKSLLEFRVMLWLKLRRVWPVRSCTIHSQGLSLPSSLPVSIN